MCGCVCVLMGFDPKGWTRIAKLLSFFIRWDGEWNIMASSSRLLYQNLSRVGIVGEGLTWGDRGAENQELIVIHDMLQTFEMSCFLIDSPSFFPKLLKGSDINWKSESSRVHHLQHAFVLECVVLTHNRCWILWFNEKIMLWVIVVSEFEYGF